MGKKIISGIFEWVGAISGDPRTLPKNVSGVDFSTKSSPKAYIGGDGDDYCELAMEKELIIAENNTAIMRAGSKVLILKDMAVVFPENPAIGDEIGIDVGEVFDGSFGTIDFNGKKIKGSVQTSPDIYDVEFGTTFYYVSEDYGWGVK